MLALVVGCADEAAEAGPLATTGGASEADDGDSDDDPPDDDGPDDGGDDAPDDDGPGDDSRGDALVELLLALTQGCAWVGGDFATDVGRPEEIPICGPSGAVFWRADTDIAFTSRDAVVGEDQILDHGFAEALGEEQSRALVNDN